MLGGLIHASTAQLIYQRPFFDIIENASTQYGMDPLLITAIMKVESGFDPHARSHADAFGLMQVRQPTADWCAQRIGLLQFDLMNPEDNIRIGVHFFAYLMEKYNGNIDVALAAYNAGEGNVDRWLNDPRFSQDGVNLDDMPFRETIMYVRNVNRHWNNYKSLYRGNWNVLSR